VLFSCMLIYSGPFDRDYRFKLLKIYIELLNMKEIKINTIDSFIHLYDYPLELENFKAIYKLSDDEFTLENAIILKNACKYTYCIDPQNQANSFIKKWGYDLKRE